MNLKLRLASFVLLVGVAVSWSDHSPLAAQENAPAKSNAWTYDEALQQLQLNPRDAYLQYVCLQLSIREGRQDEAARQVDRMVQGGDDFQVANERARGVDLFSLFSGALAVQESLQLDTMRGFRPGQGLQRRPIRPVPGPRAGTLPAPVERPVDQPEVEVEKAPASVRVQPPIVAPAQPVQEPVPQVRPLVKVDVKSLVGPTIKSHPWTQMLAGKKPDVGSMSKCVPEDFYLVEFRSLVKMLEVMDQSDLWGTHLFSQSVQEAKTQLVAERLKKQLAVETSGLLRPFYDAVVEEVAVTGSDLYVREGSDVTLLFRVKQPDVFKARMDGFLAAAEKSGAKSNAGNYLGVPFTHVATPDRGVHVYSAYPTPELHVRSNSRVAMNRIIEAVLGKNAEGKAISRLGDTDEFAYVRTLMPKGAKEEDGFIYLSDPFIRRIVGPTVKLTERRRMVCYNHLRMIGHAALMYRTEFGKAPTSLDELFKKGCSPGLFGQGDFACPEGGKYSLSPDGMTAVCSHHGTATSMTPCCEIPAKEVTGEEAQEYKAFLDAYNQYWRTFFDPIAIRILAEPKRYRVETIVLPLLDNSIYTNMARALGGKPEALDALPTPKRNIFSLAVKIDKRELLRSMGAEELLADLPDEKPSAPKGPDANTMKTANDLKQVGLAMHNYYSAYNLLPTAVGQPMLNSKLSWRVHLLPYFEHADLYQQFKLDEPWDSAHNKPLIARMPDVYRSPNAALTKEGKTRIVLPIGASTLFPPDRGKVQFQQVTDGLSNTIMALECDDAHAVVWTKPDDFAVDLKAPMNGLAVRPPGASLFLIADGSVQFLRQTTNPASVAAMFTKNAGEVAMARPEDQVAIRSNPRSGGPFGGMDVVKDLRLAELIAKGVGSQAAFHVCDAEPTFDFSLPQFFGMAMGSFNGRGAFGMGGGESMVGVLIAALNAPVYFSIPVQDEKIVDAFLGRLDGFLAVVSREKDSFGRFFRIEQDFYHMPGADGRNVRAYGFRFGPLKWRFFWGRIGKGLYVASKPFILQELTAAQADNRPASSADAPAHGLIRMRPKNWDRVLSDYKLGWAENNRDACINNLAPLAALARSMPGKPVAEVEKELDALSPRLFGVQHYCPEGGKYSCSPDCKSMTCSVHGSTNAPKQQPAPSEAGGVGKLLKEFSDMTLALTFLEDGLHAVVTIERK
jgi:hypothetical protein